MKHMIRAVIERQLLECASVAEYDIGMEQPFRHKIESGDVQIIAQPLQVSLVLQNRIVKRILFRSSSAIWKHLCPISVMAVAKDPSAKVLGFEDIDAGLWRRAVQATRRADIFVVIGSTMLVYPAAGLLGELRAGCPVYVIDPADVRLPDGFDIDFFHLRLPATEGLAELKKIL